VKNRTGHIGSSLLHLIEGDEYMIVAVEAQRARLDGTANSLHLSASSSDK
jgi:hypothetical protein